MRKTFRYTLLSLRDLAISAGLFTVLAVTLLALAYGWLGPNPPKRVTLATGSTQSANAEFGKRQLTGLRVNLGTAGSGIPSRMSRLLAKNIELYSLKISKLEQTPATVAFLEGQLDALIFAFEPESLMVQMLLQTPGIGLPFDALRVRYALRGNIQLVRRKLPV